MATSISSLYRQELKLIREEQDASESLAAQEAEKSKMFGGGLMQVQSYIGAGAKKLSGRKLDTEFQYMKDDKLISGKKFQSLAPDKGPTWFGDKEMGETSASLWESAQEYIGMELGGADQTSTVGLTSEYVQGALTEGAGIKEFGISKESLAHENLFSSAGKQVVDPSDPSKFITLPWEEGMTSKIMATIEDGKPLQVAEAVYVEGGKHAIELTKEGAQKAIEATATKSAGAVAGQAAAGVGVVTGGAQFIGGVSEGDAKDIVSGGLKTVGSAMMFAGPAAPIGAALSAVGTLLDFV